MGFDERRGTRLLGWVIGAVLAAGLIVLIARGADGPADPYLKVSAAVPTVPAVAPTTVAARTPVPGFGEVAIRVASGSQLCALLAQTAAQRSRGLMTRTDLAGHVGMVFVYPAPVAETFYMRNTPMPLSIAWFDAAGRFVSATDMAPCPDRVGCPTYAAARPYRYALEVPRGGLPGLGIGPGTALTVGGGC
ncbi:MAG: hypothetical protein JWP02_3686 [Acidimicrobiales bacterium]|nr:hypothetical protein [Acidimicrobiales bacterium]